MINGREDTHRSGGYGLGNYLTGQFYDVRIYKTNLNVAQINYLIPVVNTPTTPVFSGKPVLTGNQLVLTYTGTLLSSTNVAGPYLPVAGATSPYTNLINIAVPDLFYKLSNP